MSLLILPTNQQPIKGTKGRLVTSYPGVTRIVSPFNTSPGLSVPSSVSTKVVDGMVGYSTSATPAAIELDSWADTGAASVLIVQKRNTTGNNAWLELGLYGSELDHFPYDGLVYSDAFSGSRWISGLAIPSGKAITTTHTIILSSTANRQLASYDGNQWTSGSYSYTLPTRLKLLGASYLPFDGQLFLAVFFNRFLSLKEHKALGQNPWRIFEPESVLFYFNAVSGGLYTLTSDAGSFNLTGQAAALLAGRNLTSDAGSFNLTGQAAALLAGRNLTSDAGSFNLTGQAAALLAGRNLTSSAGSFTLAGQNATLTYTAASNAYVLTADVGAYVFSGQSANLITGRLLTCGAASLNFTGQDSALLAGRNLTADSVAFTLSGQDSSLLHGKVLTADVGGILLTGQPASLVYTQAGAYVLTANAAAFQVDGQQANLLFNRVLTGSAGSFNLTGLSANLLRGLTLPAEVGAFLLDGQAVNLVYTAGYRLVCDAGSFALSGQDSALLVNRILTASAAGYTLTGKDAALTTGTAVAVMTAEPHWQISIKSPDYKVSVKDFDHTISIH